MALDLSKLEVSIEEGERWRRTLRATVPWRLVEAERKAQIRGLAKRLDLPGFRAGTGAGPRSWRSASGRPSTI